jgi:muramoyltetrapeptide carboxypeptidase
MATSGKVFIGADDNNAISIAANAVENLVTFYGPNLDDINNRAQMERFRDFLINKGESTGSISVSTKGGDFDFCADYIPVPGLAEGPLLGGNLTALTSLFGTDFVPSFLDALLFIDDRDERTDILDRWFTMLQISNQLEKTTGIILGPFENCDSRGSFNLLSLEDDLADRLKALNKPCRFDFPIGQSSVTPIGPRARFDATNGRLDFLESIFA